MKIILYFTLVILPIICIGQTSNEKVRSYVINAYLNTGSKSNVKLNAPDYVYLDSNEIKVSSDTLLSVKLFVDVNYVKDTLGGQLYAFNQLGDYCVAPYNVEDSVLNWETLNKVYLGAHFFDFGVLNKYNSGFVLVTKDGKIQILSSLILDVSETYYAQLKINKRDKIKLMMYKNKVTIKRKLFSWQVQINEDVFRIRIKNKRPYLKQK